MDEFLKMLDSMDVHHSYTIENNFIEYDGDSIPVKNIVVQADDAGNKVMFTFLESTETLYDFNIIPKSISNKNSFRRITF